MYVLRPVVQSDLDALAACAFLSRDGITSLPKNRDRLKTIIEESEIAFLANVNKPQFEQYYFILEDTTNASALGVCGIFAKRKGPVFYYRQEQSLVGKQLPHSPEHMQILRPLSYAEGPSEICALYLYPENRQAGLGKLLSLSRFLFIATFPQRFTDSIMANMRGALDENDSSRFWEGVGRHFLDVSFGTLMQMKDEEMELLPWILPKYPIYVALLSKEIQNELGKVDSHTAPALHMLEKLGFKRTGEIDVFDAGPIISCRKEEIEAFKQSKVVQVKKVVEHLNASHTAILSNQSIDFRACMSHIEILSENEAAITVETANALKIETGQNIRYLG